MNRYEDLGKMANTLRHRTTASKKTEIRILWSFIALMVKCIQDLDRRLGTLEKERQ